MSYRLIKQYRASDANSSVPKITNNTAFSVGDIRRAAQVVFMRCTKAGTTTMDWATSASFSDWDATTYVNGTTEWEIISGKVGYVADAWTTAAGWWMVDTVGGAPSAGKPAKGLLFDQAHAGNTMYAAASETFMLAPGETNLGNWSLYMQYNNIMEWKYGLSPTERYSLPNIPASPLKIVSSDDTTPLAVGTPTYQKGYRVLAQDLNYRNVSTYGFGIGYTEWYGVIFDIDSSYISNKFQEAYNTRYCSVNTFIDCDFNLYGSRPTGVSPVLVFGEYRKHLATTTALAYGVRGGMIERREFHSCNFTVSVDAPTLGFWYECYFTQCIFTTTLTTFSTSGMLLLGDRVGASIEYEGCEFLKPIPYLFFPSVDTGPYKHTFRHCVFTDTNLPTLLDNFVEGGPADITLEFYGCGAEGEIDPASYLRVHTGYTVTKQLNIGRVGALPDVWGNQYLYYVESKSKWLKPRGVITELPHIQAGIGEGTFLVTMYIAVPPTQLLTNDEFFIYAVGPDRDGMSLHGSMPIDMDGKPVTNVFSSGRSSTDAPLVTYPTVPMSWVGLPVGWVTQAIEFHMVTDSIGRVYVVPLFAKPDAALIMCATLSINRIG